MGFIDREGRRQGEREGGSRGREGKEKKKKAVVWGQSDFFNLRSEIKGAWQGLFRTSAYYPSLLISQKAR